MRTGAQATFVISWAQTEIGGLPAGPVHALVPGATWRWAGPALRLDGPEGPLVLGGEAMAALRRRAARAVRRMFRRADPSPAQAQADGEDMPDQGFIVTDGTRRYPVRLVHSTETGARMVLFEGDLPPRGRHLRVVRANLDPKAGLDRERSVICFTPGTRLMTPTGPRRIETLRPGHLVQTMDDGALAVAWVGHCRLSAADLFAAPRLRPVRIRGGAFGLGQPDETLMVSPQHRMLVKGASVGALFNTPEALVAAEDLVNGASVAVDLTPAGVTYVHIMLDRHSIVFANGLATETFHPAGMELDALDAEELVRLSRIVPGLPRDPESYGPFARRNLSPAEAAILRHSAA